MQLFPVFISLQTVGLRASLELEVPLQCLPHRTFQRGQKRREWLSKTDITILCNVITEVVTHHLCRIIFARNKSQVPSPTQGHYNQEVGTTVNLRLCLPHKDVVLRELNRGGV